MRVLRLGLGDGHTVDLHPSVSVVTGLTVEQRTALRRAFTAIGSGLAPGEPGLLEAHGLLLDATQDDLDLLDVAAHPAPTVATAADVPGTISGEDAEALRTAERDLVLLATDRWDAREDLAATEPVTPVAATERAAARAAGIRGRIARHRARDAEGVRVALDEVRDRQRAGSDAGAGDLAGALAGVGLDLRDLGAPCDELVRIAEDWLEERRREAEWITGGIVELEALDAALAVDDVSHREGAGEVAELQARAGRATSTHANAIVRVDELRTEVLQRQVAAPGADHLERHLLARLRDHHPERLAGSSPFVLDEVFGHLGTGDVARLLEGVARGAGAVQVVVLDDHPAAQAWAEASDIRLAALVRPAAPDRPGTRRHAEPYHAPEPPPQEGPHVPVITEDDIRALAAVRSNGVLVTTCYLDVDGGRYVRPADYERALDEMVRRVRRRDEVDEAVDEDLDRIVSRVAEGFDRTSTRGVALFSCGAHDLFVVHELPVPVRNEIVVNPTPAVGQLELVLQQSEKVAVLAADKQHARVFVYRLGQLIEHVERTDDIGRDYDTVGEHDRGGVQQHRDEMTHQHLRHAAELAWSVYQSTGFDHLVVAAADGVASELEKDLHPYLTERLHGRLDLPPGSPEPDLRRAALEAERSIEAAREAALVEELRAAVHSDGKAVAGIGPVVDALADRRVDRLLVSDGYAVEGWRCDACDRLATVGRQCRCGAEMVHLPDLVEEAVEAALGQSCQVVVCDGNADLDVLGRIGALLRY